MAGLVDIIVNSVKIFAELNNNLMYLHLAYILLRDFLPGMSQCSSRTMILIHLSLGIEMDDQISTCLAEEFPADDCGMNPV